MVRRGNDSDRCRDRMVMDQVARQGSDMTVGRHGDGFQDEREDGRNNVMVKLQCVLYYSGSEQRKHATTFTSTSTSSHTCDFVLHATFNSEHCSVTVCNDQRVFYIDWTRHDHGACLDDSIRRVH